MTHGLKLNQHRRTSYQYFSNNRRLQRELVTDLADASVWRETDYLYDTRGNVSRQRVRGSHPHNGDTGYRTQTFSYLESDGYFLNSTSNALGHTTLSKVDPRHGRIWQLTDPNELITESQFDAFGREILVSSAGVPDRYTGVQACTSQHGSPLSAGACPMVVNAANSAAVMRVETRQDGRKRSLSDAFPARS